MRDFIKKIILFSITFLASVQIFYLFIIISPNLEVDKRIENLIKGDINKDIIIIGSSRGARNIIAGQIEDSIGLSTFNLSYPGSDIEFHEFLLRTLLKFNSTPKKILLSIDADELTENKTINFRFDKLYPLTKYKYVNDEMIKRGEKNIFSKFFVLSRINKKNLDISVKHFTELDTILACGSMPISFQRKDREFILKDSIPDYRIQYESPVRIKAFKAIQDLCKENNIELILIFSPNFCNYNPSFEKRIELLKGEDVKLFRYDTSNTIYKDKSYFYDEAHLQTNGAIILTNDIINFLGKNN